MATYARDLLHKNPGYPEEMAPVLVFEAFDRDPMVASNLLKTAGYDDDQIRNLLLARGETPKTIDAIMGRLDSYIQSLKKRQK